MNTGPTESRFEALSRRLQFRRDCADTARMERTERRPVPILRKDDVLIAPPADVRRIMLRVLAALPCQTGCRATVLPILIRRMPDSSLPALVRMVRCEVSSQRRFVELVGLPA